MINILGTIPKTVGLACSGGIDSMAILKFLLNGKKNVTCLYFNHQTEHSINTEIFIKNYCEQHNIPLIIDTIKNPKNKKESLEEYWRNERYSFLKSFNNPVITCHHLNDCIETWIYTSIHGNPKLIPYKNENIIRPFLTTLKTDLLSWNIRHNIPWNDDLSNNDVKYSRNRIRHNIIPEIEKINPGIYKVIKKKILEQFYKSLSNNQL